MVKNGATDGKTEGGFPQTSHLLIENVTGRR